MNDTLKNLINFIENGGLVDKSRAPKLDEPFYEEYMKQKIKSMDVKLGDWLRVTVDKKGEENVYEGILIDDSCSGELKLLIEGKKLWKTEKNAKIVPLYRIIDIKITAKVPEQFDIMQVNPKYKTKEERAAIYNEISKRKYEEEDLQNYRKNHPDVDFKYLLSLNVDLYWPYYCENASAQVSIVKKDGTVMDVDDIVMRHVFPNERWFRMVQTDSQGKNEHIILPFRSIEELRKIYYISCLWNVSYGGKTKRILSIQYPKFEEKNGYHTFNVGVESVPLAQYDFLRSNQIGLANDLIQAFSEIGIVDHGSIYVIKGSPEAIALALADCGLVPGTKHTVVENIDETIEVFTSKKIYKDSRYFSSFGEENNENRRIVPDFGRFLAGTREEKIQ